MKFLNVLIAVLGIVVFSLSACKQTPAIRLATTTSLEQSGLLGELIEAFTKKQHIPIQVITTGSGAALELGKNGDVDVIIAHAPELEKQFMDSGYGLERHSFLYSRFVVLGPLEDPAHIANAQNPEDVFKRIALYNQRGNTQKTFNNLPQQHAMFVSRGDNSGTDVLEKSIWNKIGIKPDSSWYKESGQGMSETILLANALSAYTISDLPTWLAVSESAWFKQNYSNTVTILYDAPGQQDFSNIYSVIVIKNNSAPQNQNNAKLFADFLLTEESQSIINNFSIQGIRCYNSIQP
ncbi:MAG TPA: substrate-binding domain-containing protein [Spirochaetales bacterium]|nr:substrate-binding domain-containing protein [Spirochaetales bacterium]